MALLCFALQIYSIVIYRNFHIKLSSPISRQIFLQLNYTTLKKLVNSLFKFFSILINLTIL